MSTQNKYWTIGRDLLIGNKKRSSGRQQDTSVAFVQHPCEYCLTTPSVATVTDSAGVSYEKGQQPYSLVCTPCMNLYCNEHGSQRRTKLSHRRGPTDFVCVGCVSIRVCDCGNQFTAPFDQHTCDDCEYDDAEIVVVNSPSDDDSATTVSPLDEYEEEPYPQPFYGGNWALVWMPPTDVPVM